MPADLSDEAQIARLCAHLPDNALVVSSDLIRASATADAIQGDKDRLADHPDLREINFGEWDGKPFDDIAKSHPELSRAFWETPGDVVAPGGESWNMAAARVSAAVDALADQHPDQHIIAVAHFGAILTQVQRAENLTPEEVIGHRIDNLSVTTLHQNPGGWYVESINHLP